MSSNISPLIITIIYFSYYFNHTNLTPYLPALPLHVQSSLHPHFKYLSSPLIPSPQTPGPLPLHYTIQHTIKLTLPFHPPFRLQIGALNINANCNSCYDSKVQHADFDQLTKDLDVIGLTETHASTEQDVQKQGYHHFSQVR